LLRLRCTQERNRERGMSYNVEFKVAITRRCRTQTEAAKLLGTDEPRLSRLINGYCVPTAAERRRFAAVLGVDVFVSDGSPVDRTGDTQEHHAREA